MVEPDNYEAYGSGGMYAVKVSVSSSGVVASNSRGANCPSTIVSLPECLTECKADVNSWMLVVINNLVTLETHANRAGGLNIFGIINTYTFNHTGYFEITSLANRLVGVRDEGGEQILDIYGFLGPDEQSGNEDSTSSSSGLGIGEIIGIVIGLLGGCCMLLCVLLCCICILVGFILCVVLVLLAIVIVVIAGVAAVGGGGGAVGLKLALKDKGEMVEIEMNDGETFSYRELRTRDLKLIETIGEGAYGVVYRGKWREVDVAIKQLNRLQLDVDALLDFRREAHVMAKLGTHPNVVRFIGAVTKGDYLALVTEFMPRGTLEKILVVDKIPTSGYLQVRYARDAARGLIHLHMENVIHRDIAARNCLVAKDYSVVMSDFGTSRFFENDNEEVGETASNVGPVRWMAPESIDKREYSRYSDCWMFGVLLYEIATGLVPFGEDLAYDIMIGVVDDNRHVPIPDEGDKAFQEIMEAVFKRLPEQRMDMDTISKILEERLEEMEEQGLLDLPTDIQDATVVNDTSLDLSAA